jgi:hypothetical protein
MAELIEKVKERPILFSTPMVKAILEGRKTVTRRVVKGRPLEWLQPCMFTPEFVADQGNNNCPYGQPGDILWVRETWCRDQENEGSFLYRASNPDAWDEGEPSSSPWKPSIHMPRAACRLRLEILSITVEKLQDISEEDAIREGIEPQPAFENIPQWKDYTNNGCTTGWPCVSFASLWQSINGKESWDANPFCWVINFRKL